MFMSLVQWYNKVNQEDIHTQGNDCDHENRVREFKETSRFLFREREKK